MSIAVLAESTSVVGGIAVNIGRNAIWTDEWAWTSVSQGLRRTLNGNMIVEMLFPNTNIGRQITIECGWLRRSQVDDLITIRDRDDQVTMKLTLTDGRTFGVLFDFDRQRGLEVSPIVPRPDYDAQVSPNWYDIKVYLIVSESSAPTAYAYVGPEEPDA